MHISIHAPRTGSDITPCDSKQQANISIHAPRTGSDTKRFPAAPASPYFNPRSPHGERLRISAHTVSRKLFQSTLPARGAT